MTFYANMRYTNDEVSDLKINDCLKSIGKQKELENISVSVSLDAKGKSTETSV